MIKINTCIANTAPISLQRELSCHKTLRTYTLGLIGKESNPLFLAGTAISLINASDALIDAITEPAIGALLDIFGKVGSSNEFSLFSYHVALAILPLYQIIGALMLRWVKDDN